MLADRQRSRQTDVVIAILRFPIGGAVITTRTSTCAYVSEIAHAPYA